MTSISAIFSGVIGAVLGFIAGGYVAFLLNLHGKIQFLGLALVAAVLGAVFAIAVTTRWHLTNGRLQLVLLGVLAVGLAVVFLRFTHAV